MNKQVALPGMIAIAVLFFVSLAGMVVWFDYTFARDFFNARAAASFVPASGEIEDVITTVDNVEGAPVTLYEFKYQYTVDGQDFRRSSRDGAQFQSRYPKAWDAGAVKAGDRVPVFYDAREPSRAVLDQSVDKTIWIPAIILGIGNLLLLFFIRGGIRIWLRYRKYRCETAMAK